MEHEHRVICCRSATIHTYITDICRLKVQVEHVQSRIDTGGKIMLLILLKLLR